MDVLWDDEELVEVREDRCDKYVDGSDSKLKGHAPQRLVKSVEPGDGFIEDWEENVPQDVFVGAVWV